MPYRNKQMLRDANGDLIPQYWDVVEQDFKPLTGQGGANDVRLTGSNVELIKSLKDNMHFENVGRLIVLGDNISTATADAYPIISPGSHLSIYLNNNGSHNFWIERFYFTNSSDRGSYMHFLDGLKLEVAPGETEVYTSEDLGIENIQFVGFFLWLRAETNNFEGTIDVDIIASKN